MLFGNSKHRHFDRLFRPHLDAVYNLARYLCGNAADAEDIVQEVYLKAYRAFDNYTDDNGRAWILAITRNTSYSWLRKQGYKLHQAFDEEAHSQEDNHYDCKPGNCAGPDVLAENACQLQSVTNAIEALPVEFREVIVLREIEEFSYEEISEVLGIPKGTVMSRLARARTRLQKPLAGIREQGKT